MTYFCSKKYVMKIFICSVISLLAGACIGHILTANRLISRSSATPEHDTVTSLHIDTILHHDTIIISHPQYIETTSPRTVTISRNSMARCDSITLHDIAHCDTDSITLCTVRRIYSDSLFRAVVSGIDPRLDSLTLFRPIPTITRSITRQVPPVANNATSRWGHSTLRQSLSASRFSLGITAGISATPHGLTPAMTLGLTYRLWP